LLKAATFPGRLGFRGFTALSDSGLFSTIRILDGVVDLGPDRASLWDPCRRLEKWLLTRVFRQYIEPDVAAVIEEDFAKNLDDFFRFNMERWAVSPARVACVPLARDAPVYDYARWNFSPARGFNNCYNYANDQVLCHFGTPGGASAPFYTLDVLQKAVIADGLKCDLNLRAPLPPLQKGEGWYVAVATTVDSKQFHFLRQDACGCWSHKPGRDDATNLDFTNHFIVNPETADLDPFVFLAYMVSNSSVIVK
jgi:hypothetical protein